MNITTPDWFGPLLLVIGIGIIMWTACMAWKERHQVKDQTNSVVEHPLTTTSNILSIERIEPSNRPPLWLLLIGIAAFLLIFAFAVFQAYLVISGTVNAKFSWEWIGFYLLFGVLPIWVLLDFLVFNRKYYKSGRSATAIDATFVVSGDITDVFNKCSDILETMNAKTIIKTTPNLIKASLNKSNISIEVSPSDDNVKVYIVSDSTWVTVKIGKGRNERNIDEFQRCLFDEFRISKSENTEGVQPIVKAKDNYADIQVKPQIAHNRAALEVINSGADANFTAKAIVVKGVPPKTRYTMCWDSPPHLEHPIKRGDKSTIIVAEKTSAIMGMETPGIVKNGLALYKMGMSGEVERVGATTQELSDAVKLNIRYPTMATLVDDSCTIEITITSTPPLLNTFKNQKYKTEIDHEHGHKLLIAPLPELETHINLDLVKLFHDGKDIRSELEEAKNDRDTNKHVTAQLHFEAWFACVTRALEGTEYRQMWYEHAVIGRESVISECAEFCGRALERLESIMQLASRKEGSQSQ